MLRINIKLSDKPSEPKAANANEKLPIFKLGHSNMKHDILKSIAHNIADSLASGIGLLIGIYEMDVFGEARSSPEKFLTVDFLAGMILDGQPSPSLREAVQLYKEALPNLCIGQGGSISDFRELTVRYYGHYPDKRFIVTIVDKTGRRSSNEYSGVPGKRVKVLDSLGRIRTKPAEKN